MTDNHYIMAFRASDHSSYCLCSCGWVRDYKNVTPMYAYYIWQQHLDAVSYD